MTSLTARVAHLEEAFRTIAATRMQGLPLLNGSLQVQALGFQPLPGDEAAALGVLLTPWFMNLVRLPLDAEAEATVPAVGVKREHQVGELHFEFIGTHEAALGRFEMCSMFSPVFEFANQAGALAVAREVLALLRPTPVAQQTPERPARRGFLFGRSVTASAGGLR